MEAVVGIHNLEEVAVGNLHNLAAGDCRELDPAHITANATPKGTIRVIWWLSAVLAAIVTGTRVAGHDARRFTRVIFTRTRYIYRCRPRAQLGVLKEGKGTASV